jgi:hypothetical protein
MKSDLKELVIAAEKLAIELVRINGMIKLAIDGEPVSELDLFIMNHFTLDEARSKPVFISELVDYFKKHYVGVVSAKSISHAMSRRGFKSHVVRISGKSFRVYYVRVINGV